MSGKIPALPPATPEPVKAYPKPSSPATASSTPRPAERHPAPALTPADVGYVDGLMGFAPAQTMEYIMLKTGVPMPENLGQDLDTSV
jgi:hypothetical protein